MKASNEQFILSEKLDIFHEHCRVALQEQEQERLYDLLYNYQKIIRDEIKRCLGTSDKINTFSPQKHQFYSATFLYFRKEILWHIVEFSLFLSLAKDTILSRKDGDFLYPSEIVVMFIELIEASTFKQCVLSNAALVAALQKRETTETSVEQFNHLAEQTAKKWRFILSQVGGLDQERDLTDEQYRQSLPDALRVYFTEQSEHLPTANIKVLASSTNSAGKQLSEPEKSALQVKPSSKPQDSLVPYQKGSADIDYFSESIALPEECSEEMMVWLILLNSELLLQRKIAKSFDDASIATNVDGSSMPELVLQQLDYVVRRVSKLFDFFVARNDQLETEIERRLSDVTEHVKLVADAVEKLFLFVDDARKWTKQLVTKPETCEQRPIHFEFESSVIAPPTREETSEERLMIVVKKEHAPGYSQSLSLFVTPNQSYKESPQQKFKNLQEKFRHLFQDCQAERAYLKELLYVRCNRKDGLDLCEKTDQEQSMSFNRTKNDYELTITEWQAWQKNMFGHVAELEKIILEANTVASMSNLGGYDAGKECRK
jgi:hypothetical protein